MKNYIFLFISVFWLISCQSDELFKTRTIEFDVVSIHLNKTQIENMITGETRQLTISFTPAETTQRDVVWESSNAGIVSVDENGKIKALGLGTAEITASSLSNSELTAACTVCVTETSGISITDVLLNDAVGSSLTFVRGDSSRDYTYQVIVYNSLNEEATIQSSNPAVLGVTPTVVDGMPGFTLIPGMELGSGELIISSVAQPDLSRKISFTVMTVSVTGVELSLNADGTGSSAALVGEMTMGHTKSLRVVFQTDPSTYPIPENKTVHCSSSNTSLATVPANGEVDLATGFVYVKVNIANTPGKVGESATITVRTDDGNYVATYTVTAKLPDVTGLKLNTELSEPIHAGESTQLKFTTIPEDAYIQTVTWSSSDESVATVDANGIVTVKENFLFDAENPSLTEIVITATSDDVANGTIVASCTIRPYQYVAATGVMVTDQWGNRIPQHRSSSSGSKIPEVCCVQYASGTGTNKTSLLNELYSWGNAIPSYPDADKVGSVKVYLTLTPVPYTYPKITDPNQEFYWQAYSNSRFAMPDPQFKEGNTSTGYGITGTSDDGKKVLLKARTMLFYTGHSSSTTDINDIRIFRVVDEDLNDGTYNRTNLMVGRFGVHTNKGEDKSGNNNPTLAVTGGGKLCNIKRPDSPYLSDPAPWPWPENAPDPTPVEGPNLSKESITKIRATAYPAN